MGLTRREGEQHVRMADLELLYFDPPDAADASPVPGIGKSTPRPEAPAPRTELRGAAEETETSFSRKDADEVRLLGTRTRDCSLSHSSSSEVCEEEEEEEVLEEEVLEEEDQEEEDQEEEDQEEEEDVPELYLLSDDDLSSEGAGKSVDYGFILAVTCLVTGISLVAISYAVPRDVRVDPDSVSAREMERLEREKAAVGAHLDRCVIAGLCLLTLGGVLLSTLLMVSMWKGEMMRRRAFAYSKHAARLYGSVSLRAGGSPARGSGSRLSSSAADEDPEAVS